MRIVRLCVYVNKGHDSSDGKVHVVTQEAAPHSCTVVQLNWGQTPCKCARACVCVVSENVGHVIEEDRGRRERCWLLSESFLHTGATMRRSG